MSSELNEFEREYMDGTHWSDEELMSHDEGMVEVSEDGTVTSPQCEETNMDSHPGGEESSETFLTHRITGQTEDSVINRSDSTDCPEVLSQSLVVLELSPDTAPEAVRWLHQKIISSRQAGGGELQAALVRGQTGQETVFHLSITKERLLLAAELMEMKKECLDGTMKEFTITDMNNGLFMDSEEEDSGMWNMNWNMAETQQIIKHELETIRAKDSDPCVPGMDNISFYTGETIIPKCLSKEMIVRLFPLHDKEELKVLGEDWYNQVFAAQPIRRIRAYFGETVAMYFSFLGFYTMALLPPALIGTMSVIWLGRQNMNLQIFFSVFNIVWATVFLEAWKRNCACLAFSWGTINTEQFEEARPQYYGTLGRNPVTGRQEPQFPPWQRKAKFYCVSVPFMLLCLSVAFCVMLVYFWLQELANNLYVSRGGDVLSLVVTLLPSMVYAIVIAVMNAIYRTLARKINDWENHRLQSSYDNHLIIKLVVFDFSNCFMSLFWVAFYLQDMALLRSHLGTLLIVQQVIGQVRESVLPYILQQQRKHKIEKQDSKDKSGNEAVSCEKTVSTEQQLQARIEGSRDEYDVCKTSGTLDDYLEMFLQFGYVFLFSSVFPSAALWALLNNVTEIRSDAFKLCRVFQRPFREPTGDIGAWLIAFELLSMMAVITNCGLIGLSPHMKDYSTEYGTHNVIIMFVIAEHILLFVKKAVSSGIPDTPKWVEDALNRQIYQAKKAVRKERVMKSQNELQSQTGISRSSSVIQTPEILENLGAKLDNIIESVTTFSKSS